MRSQFTSSPPCEIVRLSVQDTFWICYMVRRPVRVPNHLDIVVFLRQDFIELTFHIL